MKTVLLVNDACIPHYRVSVYNYLSQFLEPRGFSLSVVSSGIQEGSDPSQFDCHIRKLSFASLSMLIRRLRPAAVIFWVRLRFPYKIPLVLFARVMGAKVIYWGHGRELYAVERNRVKDTLYRLEHGLYHALILYAPHLKKHVWRRFRDKVFIANNTLYLPEVEQVCDQHVLERFGITTKKNIICVGRMQARKRIDHLVEAHALLNDPEIGLILVGPDPDGELREIEGPSVFKLGPVYGSERLALLKASDVYCLPGAVGLSIVDAFLCGLPLVTEEGDESPEGMYLKDGVNGFMVSKGDVPALSGRLRELLDDDTLRASFSNAARNEIQSNGHIDVMCKGFASALQHALA